MENLKQFINIAIEQGSDIVKPILVKDIKFDFRTTYKCFTCSKYNTVPLCPPNIPDYNYFQRLINCYKYGLIVVKEYKYNTDSEYEKARIESGARIQNILLFLEKQAFHRNYYWSISFIGGSCRYCGDKCNMNGKCNNKKYGRIPVEAIGIDVISTCKNIGIDIVNFPHPNDNGKLQRIGLFLLE